MELTTELKRFLQSLPVIALVISLGSCLHLGMLGSYLGIACLIDIILNSPSLGPVLER